MPAPRAAFASKGGPGAPAKYPFKTMQVGDSFEFTPKDVKNAASRMHRLGKIAAPGRKFATRSDTTGKLRVWRVL